MVALTRERCSLPVPTPHVNGWVRWESWSWDQRSRGDIPCSLRQLQHLRKQVPHLPWAKQYRQSCGWRYGWATPEAVNKGEMSPLLIYFDSKTDLQQLSLGEHTPHLTGATQWSWPLSFSNWNTKFSLQGFLFKAKDNPAYWSWILYEGWRSIVSQPQAWIHSRCRCSTYTGYKCSFKWERGIMGKEDWTAMTGETCLTFRAPTVMKQNCGYCY